jgi:hypothetical protein
VTAGDGNCLNDDLAKLGSQEREFLKSEFLNVPGRLEGGKAIGQVEG